MCHFLICPLFAASIRQRWLVTDVFRLSWVLSTVIYLARSLMLLILHCNFMASRIGGGERRLKNSVNTALSMVAILVQHLIETCLMFRMSKEECLEALSKHANIKPVITTTVWNELEKENRQFFESYSQSQSKVDDRMSDTETSELIQKLIAGSSKDNPDV